MKSKFCKFTLITLLLSLCLVSACAHNQNWPSINKAEGVSGEDLPLVGSYVNMKKLLKKYDSNQGNFRLGLKMGAQPDVMEQSVNQESVYDSSSAPGFSETNVQVKGVDESDLVKTDGAYIYQVVNNSVKISKAYPVNHMKVADRKSVV